MFSLVHFALLTRTPLVLKKYIWTSSYVYLTSLAPSPPCFQNIYLNLFWKYKFISLFLCEYKGLPPLWIQKQCPERSGTSWGLFIHKNRTFNQSWDFSWHKTLYDHLGRTSRKPVLLGWAPSWTTGLIWCEQEINVCCYTQVLMLSLKFWSCLL